MVPFTFQSAGRIVFGRGVSNQAASLIAPFGKRVLLIRGTSVVWADQLTSELETAGCKIISFTGKAEPNVETVKAALDAGLASDAELVVGVGGGAILDLGKACAALLPSSSGIMQHLECVGGAAPLNADPLPYIAIPTTAGTGAEVTKNAVISVPEAGRKVSLRDDRMLPNVALIDPALCDGCPRQVTLASGFDAITQLIEPYLSARANPVTDALVRAALPRGLAALAQLAKEPDAAARDAMSFASVMGGLALANAGLGAVHGLAGVIGGRFDAPHGLICARLLGPVLDQNQRELASSGAVLTRFEETAELIATAFDLPRTTCFSALPHLLDQLEMPRLSNWIPANANLHVVVNEASGASSMKANPCVLPPEALKAALDAAL